MESLQDEPRECVEMNSRCTTVFTHIVLFYFETDNKE